MSTLAVLEIAGSPRQRGRLSTTPGVDEIKSLLANREHKRHPVSRRHKPSGSSSFTFASVIWELGADLRAHVAPWSPCSVPFQSFPLCDRANRQAAAQ